MRWTLLIILISSYGSLSAQIKYDYTWPFGYDFDTNIEGYETTLLEFGSGAPTTRLVKGKLDLSASIAAISDPVTGRLLFYSNGCSISDSSHQTMQNGEEINFGVYHWQFCEGRNGYYPLQQGMTVLPDQSNPQGYYLIHRTKFWTDTPCNNIKYSYIDMSLNNGLGAVTKKNQTIVTGYDYICGYVTAVKHANGHDWWITMGRRDSTIHHTFLLDKDGFSLVHEQEIGLPYISPGQAAFSPDGTKYVAFDDSRGLYVYDFDRTTGLLSNFRMAHVEINNLVGGVAISPNSRYAYVIITKKIIQVDLEMQDIDQGIETVAIIDTTIGTFFEQNFGFAMLGPDCKIYVVPGSGSHTIHTIHQPNEKGIACDVRQQFIKLPSPRSNWSVANFPHFRIDEDEICDPGITSIFPPTFINTAWEVWPNPASGSLQVSNAYDSRITLYNKLGQEVMAFAPSKEEIRTLDISTLDPGMYIIAFQNERAVKHVTKFIKI